MLCYSKIWMILSWLCTVTCKRLPMDFSTIFVISSYGNSGWIMHWISKHLYLPSHNWVSTESSLQATCPAGLLLTCNQLSLLMQHISLTYCVFYHHRYHCSTASNEEYQNKKSTLQHCPFGRMWQKRLQSEKLGALMRLFKMHAYLPGWLSFYKGQHCPNVHVDLSLQHDTLSGLSFLMNLCSFD